MKVQDLYTPVSKGECGLFGVLRRKDAPKVGSSVPLRAVECARFRGSNLGAGFAAFDAKDGHKPPYRVKVFVDGPEALSVVRGAFCGYAERGLKILSEREPEFDGQRRLGVWTAFVEASDELLSATINQVNAEMKTEEGIRARVYSSGRYVNVYKDVGYPMDVARICDLVDDRVLADLWLSHTRQPTNSPGTYPIWSHPFASFECAIIHNGDISSFGANMQLLNSLGMTSHVGTDSEVIAQLLDHLVRVEGMSVQQAAKILSNPYERWLEGLGEVGQEMRDLMVRYRGAQLDGPFTVIAGYSDGHDAYLLGLVDRSKFRPIVAGEDDGRIYIASEECQIRAVSPNAVVWAPEPGRFVLASVKKGLIEAGRAGREYFMGPYFKLAPLQIEREPAIHREDHLALLDAQGLGYKDLNRMILDEFLRGAREVHVRNVNGQRYIGVNLHGPSIKEGSRLGIYGTPGNCLANFNSGVHFVVYGNAEDNVADTMHAGRVVIHGDARDVVGQALQGGEIFVRGNVGNRAAIQMREYKDRRPFMIVGGRADDYLGEYMAGGVVVVLGLGAIGGGYEGQLVGGFAGTGMVGGRIYVRGRVREDTVGLPPPKEDVINYLHSLVMDGLLDEEKCSSVLRRKVMTYRLLRAELPSDALERVKRYYMGKYIRPLNVEYRELNGGDMRLLEPKLRDFFTTFGLDGSLYESILSSKFTLITPEEERALSGEAAEQVAEE